MRLGTPLNLFSNNESAYTRFHHAAASHERAQAFASPRWRLVEIGTTLRARPSRSART
jgi:hypothetical protein